MNSVGHPAAHFAVVLHQCFNMLHIIFGIVIPQEALNHCYKAVQRRFLRSSKLLWEFFTLYDFIYLWSDEDIGFNFCLGKELKST